MPHKPGKGKTTSMNSYLRSKVKRANERLRKLETVNKLSESSEAYKSIQKFAMDPNSPSNKFYRFVKNKDGSTGVRFILPKDYSKLSAADRLQYERIVNQFLESKTSTKLGIEQARKNAYDEFMKNHEGLDWSQEEYSKFWDKFGQMSHDEEEKNKYDRLMQMLEDPEFDYRSSLSDENISQIQAYVSNDFRYDSIPVKGTYSNNRNA